MAIHSPTRKLTYEDFVRIPEDGLRHEILDGVHVVTPAPSYPHQAAAGNLHGWIWTYLRTHPVGDVLMAPFDVRLSEHDIVEPDLLYFSRERFGSLSKRLALGPPSLAVEVLSPSSRRRDLNKKRERYELLGVGEYWVLDPEERTVRIYLRDGAVFLPPRSLSAEAGDRLATALLPGLEIPLAEIFRFPLLDLG